MRISDWSSDVCSSDLDAVAQESQRRHDLERRPGRIAGGRRSVLPLRARTTRCGEDPPGLRVEDHDRAGRLDAGQDLLGLDLQVDVEGQLERLAVLGVLAEERSEEHTSELQSLMRISY